MDDRLNICIGIQARSTSKRLPNKALQMVGDKPLLQHVIDACKKSALYMNRHQTREVVQVAVLTPKATPLCKLSGERCLLLRAMNESVVAICNTRK